MEKITEKKICSSYLSGKGAIFLTDTTLLTRVAVNHIMDSAKLKDYPNYNKACDMKLTF